MEEMSAIPEEKEVVVVREAELERETVQRRRGRDILLAIDHTPFTKNAFNWTLAHLCRLADTLHFLHVLPGSEEELLCTSPKTKNQRVHLEAAEAWMDKLAAEAYDVTMVKTESKVVYGDPGKEICAAAARIKPIATVLGSRGRGIVKSLLMGSVSEYWRPSLLLPCCHRSS
ncbi:hypothetical protein O6H91_09G102500 [Diphasiastrum complanatum]|uniref:Uncharacterized protein n=1 Tax=Diphasiastrum complanatum TaxID=34168 RepID=A0ACC2CSS8_DIPCM|nr:hypothetical protein O6H91_09G102500 [Diphasiastrum complanatum]